MIEKNLKTDVSRPSGFALLRRVLSATSQNDKNWPISTGLYQPEKYMVKTTLTYKVEFPKHDPTFKIKIEPLMGDCRAAERCLFIISANAWHWYWMTNQSPPGSMSK